MEWHNQLLDGELHILAREGLPIVPFHILAELKVKVLPSSPIVQDSARPGIGESSGPLYSSRLSKIFVDTRATGTAVVAIVDKAEGSGW